MGRIHSARRRDAERGFTMIELMVVIAIIAILASIVGPKLIGRTEKAKQAKAKAQISHFKTCLTAFYLDIGRYPTTEEGLDALITPPGGIDSDKYQEGGYLDSAQVPKDPWGKPYVYTSPGSHGQFDLVSYGRDGRQGGSGLDADIESWNLE